MLDRDKLRAIFKAYRQRITELLQTLNNQHYYAEEAESRRIRRERQSETERLERERQAESDRWYQDEELRKVTHDLERARSWGNDYEERRAIERLKRLG